MQGIDSMYEESLRQVEGGEENVRLLGGRRSRGCCIGAHSRFQTDDEGSYAVDSEYMSGVANVVHLRRGEVYVDLISSSTPAATFPIVKFWSTVPMCFLTENGIHILYPRLQEENRVLLNPFRLPPPDSDSPPPAVVRMVGQRKAHMRSLVAKYIDRGYDVQHTEHAWDDTVLNRSCLATKAAACPRAVRWVGDGRCMDLFLGGGVDVRIHTPVEDLGLGSYTSVWSLGGARCGPLCGDGEERMKGTSYTLYLDYGS